MSTAVQKHFLNYAAIFGRGAGYGVGLFMVIFGPLTAFLMYQEKETDPEKRKKDFKKLAVFLAKSSAQVGVQTGSIAVLWMILRQYWKTR